MRHLKLALLLVKKMSRFTQKTTEVDGKKSHVALRTSPGTKSEESTPPGVGDFQLKGLNPTTAINACMKSKLNLNKRISWKSDNPFLASLNPMDFSQTA